MAVEGEKARASIVLAAKAVFWLVVVAFLIFYSTLISDLLQGIFTHNSDIQNAIPGMLDAAFLIGSTQVFLLITRFVISNYLYSSEKEKEIGILLTLYTYVVWAITAIILASTFFKDVGALLTSLGLIGFGITFALQKPILNFVGWLNIVFTNPFSVGDRIEVVGIRGDVISIHSMYTKVQGTLVDSHTKSEKVITIPNELILTNPNINYTRNGDVYTDSFMASITYESNWRKAIQILERVAEASSMKFLKTRQAAARNDRKTWREAVDLLQEASKKLKKGFLRSSLKSHAETAGTDERIYQQEAQKPRVQLKFGNSSIDLEVIYQTDVRSQRPTKDDIARAFMEEVERQDDIEFAYPHMQIVYGERPKVVRGDRTIRQWLGEGK